MRKSKGKWVASKRDVWSLDYTLNPIIYAALVKFKEEYMKDSFKGVPHDFASHDENNVSVVEQEEINSWLGCVDKMIYSFDQSKEPDIRDYDFKINFERFPTENKDRTRVVTSCTNDEERDRYHKDCREHAEKCQLGRELFARYYKNLWI